MMNLAQRIVILVGTAVLVLLVFVMPKTYRVIVEDYNPISKYLDKPFGRIERVEERFDNRRVALEALTVVLTTAGLVLVFKGDTPAKNHDEDEAI